MTPRRPFPYLPPPKRPDDGAGIVWTLVALSVLLVLAMAALVAFAPMAKALTTPAPFPECLQREVLPDLRSAGASAWELQAFDAITRGGQSKRPADVIAIGCEIVLGSAHFPAGRLGAYEPPEAASYCEAWDREARWRALAWLYSDASGSIQLRVWRRGIAPALTAAREAGWESDRDLALMGAVANTSPSLFRRLLSECEGDRDCVASEYGSGSAHRERRIQWLEGR